MADLQRVTDVCFGSAAASR